MRELVMQDVRPYLPVMIAAFLINVLSLAGIVFSMQVYDRVIPAQSYPTLYVLSLGVLVAVVFGFCCAKRAPTLWMCSANAPICVFLTAYSATPCGYETAPSPLHRQLYFPTARAGTDPRDDHLLHAFYHCRSAIFLLVYHRTGDYSPTAGVDRPGRGLADDFAGAFVAEKLAVLANQAAHEATLRNAVLVESVQGLEDIKLMQAENRFCSNGTVTSVSRVSLVYAPDD